MANAVPVLPALITQVEGVSPVADTVITVAPEEASSAIEPVCPDGIVTSESETEIVTDPVWVVVPSETVTVRV